MGEKLFIQRRGSTHSDSGKVSFKSGLGMTSVSPAAEPNVPDTTSSPFWKDEEPKPEGDAVPGLHPSPGSRNRTFQLKESR